MFFSWFNPKWPKAILLQVPKILYISRAVSYLTHHIKGQTNSKWFFKPMFLPKNERTNSTLLWYLRSTCFCLFFWKKLKTPKRHFQMNWPLVQSLSFQRATLKILTEPGLPILAPLKQRAKVTANNVIPSRAQKCDEAPMPATTITQYVWASPHSAVLPYNFLRIYS